MVHDTRLVIMSQCGEGFRRDATTGKIVVAAIAILIYRPEFLTRSNLGSPHWQSVEP
jgi:hypothetical protein